MKDLLGMYEKEFGERLVIPIFADPYEFLDAVKRALVTHKPIDKKKWYGDGSVAI